MAEIKGKDVSWKQLWQLVSGIHYETPRDTVATKLTEISAQLRDGLHSQCDAGATVAKVISTKASLSAFSTSLQHYLGLTAVQASNLICSYLEHEYKGSATSLLNLLATEVQRQRLLADLAKYHALERMILLKIVRNVLELHTSRHHPYGGEYAAVLRSIGLPAMLRSYIEQLAQLIRATAPPAAQQHPATDYGAGAYGQQSRLVAWSERRMRECAEVLHIVLLLVEHGGIAAAQVVELFGLFRLHSFGRQQQQQHLDANNGQHVELVNRVTYAEVALFMRCCSSCAGGENGASTFAADVIRGLQKQMPALVQHAEHGPVLLAWMLFNVRHAGSVDQQCSSDEDQLQQQLRLRQFGSRAIQLGVFEYLLVVVRHAGYKDNSSAVARIVRRTVYDQLAVLCDLFDGDGSVAQHPRIYELLAELLRTPALARDFCGREDGVRSLWQTTLENFPLDWVALSAVAEAVASTGAAQQHFIRKQLETLPIYTELLRPASSYHLKPAAGADNENEFVLLSTFAPFAKIDYNIPAGTTAIVQDKPFGSTIHFRCAVNYFNVLHNEINELLAETLRYDHHQTDAGARERRVCAGIRLLANAVRNVTDPLRGISSEMVHPTEMVFDILTKFKAVQQPPVELLARCLEVCANLVPLFDEEIVRRVVNLNVLPMVSGAAAGDYRALCQGVGFESGLVGYYLINFEKNCGRYDFLQTYLEFLQVYAKRSAESAGQQQHHDIELSGLVFILREILPHMHGWHFEREADRQNIYTSIFRHLLSVLQASEADGKAAVLLRNVCVESLLNLDNGMVLLRFIAIGNDHLQSVMQNVSNWMTAAETGPNHLVQLAMTTLMQILRLRNKSTAAAASHDPIDQLSPLESIIYTQPKQRDTLRIIPCVTSYMSNIFNRRLPLLACRLLRRFAIEFQMSLLACLDMEPDQIRLTFLARLPDELESDQLKMAVIEFVEACIHKQPGLTEAFFRIRNERRFGIGAGGGFDSAQQRPKEIGDGILTYMTQYLCAVAADPQCICSPLLSKILALFHALWKNNMQSLVQDLQQQQQKTEFWSALCKPLFADIQPGISAYSQLFNMLGIELFRCGGAGAGGAQLDPALAAVLRRLLQPECLNRWVDSVLKLPLATIGDQVPNETPEWLCRLQSFKDFIVLAMRRKQQQQQPAGNAAANAKEADGTAIAIPAESLRYFADQCLRVLCERAEYLEDNRPFIILAELYLILMVGGGGGDGCDAERKYTETPADDDRQLVQITRLLNQTAISYRELHARARESILAIALRAVVLLAGDMDRQPAVAVDFMRSIVEVLCFELQATENQIIGWRQQTPQQQQAGSAADDDTTQHPQQSQSFILCLNLLKQISASFAAHRQFAGHWTAELIANRILNRLLSCLNAALPVHRFRRIVVEMLDVLIDLAQAPACSAELLHSDIVNYLWIRLLPPKEMLQIFGSASGAAGNASAASAVAAPTSQLDRSAFGGLNASTFSNHNSSQLGAGGLADGGGDKSLTAAAASSSGWQTNDWWPIYARGLQLVTVLLQQHRHVFLKDALLFVGVHEEYVVDAVMLAKQTLDADAVRLIKTALLLVCELVQYEKHWRLEHAASLINLMRSVQSIMDHSVSLLYRPMILQRLIEKTTNQPQAARSASLDLTFGGNQSLQPTPELITAMNDLVEFVTICSRALLAFSPKLLDMLVEPQFEPSHWQPLVEIQFGAPKLYVGNAVPQLTFGTILSAAAIFTKSLNLQNYHFYETPINRLTFRRRRPIAPATDDDDDEDDSPDLDLTGDHSITRSRLARLSESSCADSPQPADAGLAHKSATRSMLTKSLSMTSTTSAASAATAAATSSASEILQRLDETQCVRALEFVLTVLCSQSLLALRDRALSQRDKQLIKRELSTELAVFHEFVRRRVMPADAVLGGGRDPLLRKKRGQAHIRVTEDAGEDAAFEAVSPATGADRSATTSAASAAAAAAAIQRNRPLTMREKVMRQQHQLQATAGSSSIGAAGSLKRPTTSGGGGGGACDISPIASTSTAAASDAAFTSAAPAQKRSAAASSLDAAASTPLASILSSGGATGKRVTFPSNPVQRDGSDSTFVVDRDVCDAAGAYNETVYIGNEDAAFTGLSLVQLVESDYLHLLSLVFMQICQHD